MSMTHWTPRTMARVAAAGVIVIAMALITGAESSAGEQPADATLSYSCPFSSGTQKVSVKIAATFPATGTAGRPIQPDGVTVTPTLPRAALDGLNTTSVTAVARLTVTVTQNGNSTDAGWPGLPTPSTPVPGSGDLALPASGSVPATTVKATGPVAFDAGPLELVLRPHKTGGAAKPAPVPLDCTLDVGSNATLATVPVTESAGSATPPPGAGSAKSKSALRNTAQKPADDDPCLLPIDLPPVPGEAYLAGFSNVNKLNGAALLGREDGLTIGHSTLELNYRVIIDLCSTNGSTHILSRGLLEYNGEHKLPPAKATFLTFGFMPTTATLELTEPAGTDLEIDSHGFQDDDGNFQEETTVTSQLSIRIHDVLVNGVPLNVGPHCESATPLAVTLDGKSPEYTVNTGGPLTGTATIPPFTGCGVGEDLDPLFTASISGPGNFMKLTQGIPCTRPVDGDPVNCDPIDRPIPLT